MTRRLVRHRLFATTALAAALCASMPAEAQTVTLPTGGVIGHGTVTRISAGNTSGDGMAAATAFKVTPSDTQLTLNVAGPAVIRWDSFNIAAGSTLSFTGTNFTVLNVVTGNETVSGTPAQSMLSGTLNGGGGSVWLINPAGILIGGGTFTNLSSLVLSTLPLTKVGGSLFDATGNPGLFAAPANSGTAYTFAGTGAALTVQAGTTITTTGNVVLVAPRADIGGTVMANGDVGLALAAAATLTLTPTSIVGIALDAGTTVGTTNTVDGTVQGQHVRLAALSQTNVIGSLLSVSGLVTATTVTTTDAGIVLAAGAAVSGVTVGTAGQSDLTVSGQLVAPGGAQAVLATNGALTLSGSGALFTGTGTLTGSAATALGLSGTGTPRLSTGGDVALTAGSATAAGTVTLSGNYTSGGAVTLSARAPGAGAANLIVTGSLAVDGALSVTGDSGIAIGRNASLRGDALGALAGAAGLTLNAQFGSVVADPTALLAAGTLAGATEGHQSVVVIGALDPALDLTLGRVEAQALKRTNITTDIAIAGSVTTAQVDTTDALALTSTAGDVKVAGATSIGGGITLTAVPGAGLFGNVTAGPLASAAGFDVTVSAAKRVSVTNTVTSGRDLLVTAGTGVLLGSAGATASQQAQRTIDVVATTGDIAVPNTGIVTLTSNTAAGNAPTAGSLTLAAIAGSVLGSGTGNGTLDLATGSAGADREVVTTTAPAGGRVLLGDVTALRLGSASGSTTLAATGDVVLGATLVDQALTVQSASGDARVGAGSRATSIAATANAAGKTAEIQQSAVTTGSLVATATAGTATAAGSAGGDIEAFGGSSASANGTAGGHILATADLTTGTARASGTATADYIKATGNDAGASGDAGTSITALGTAKASASGTTLRVPSTGTDIVATATTGDATATGTATGRIEATGGSTATASGTAGDHILATADMTTGTASASGTATDTFIRATADTATATGSAGTDIEALGRTTATASSANGQTAAGHILATADMATGTARASGIATADYIRATGNDAGASGDAGTSITALGTAKASASGTTMRTSTGGDIVAGASIGDATTGGTARLDIIGSAPKGTLTFTDATALRDVIGTGATVTSTAATLTAGDDIIIAATQTAAVGRLVFAATSIADNAAAPLDAFGGPVFDPTLATPIALPVETGHNIVALAGMDFTATKDVTTPGDLRLGSGRDLSLDATAEPVTLMAGGTVRLEAGRSVTGLGVLTVRSDSDATGSEPIVVAAGGLAAPGGNSINLASATLIGGSDAVAERSADVFIVTTASVALGDVRAHALLSAAPAAATPPLYSAAYSDGSLRVGGTFVANDLRLVQGFDLQATDAVTIKSIEVTGRVTTGRSVGLTSPIRDDIVVSAPAITITDHAYALAGDGGETPGGDVSLTATGFDAGALLITDAADIRARHDATLTATDSDLRAARVWAGHAIMLTGLAATDASDLVAGDTVSVTATAGAAKVGIAETTGQLLDAKLAGFTGAATGVTHAITVVATASATRSGDATLVTGTTFVDPTIGHETSGSTIVVTATGGNATVGALTGPATTANDIALTATGTTAFGTVTATATNVTARTGNIFATAASATGTSTVIITQATATTQTIGGFADTANAFVDPGNPFGSSAMVSGTAGRDIVAEASGIASATGMATRYIFAGAGGDAGASGGASSIVARGGRDATASGVAGVDIAAYAGRDASASGTATAGDLLATADTGNATLAGSAGTDALATALAGTATLSGVTAGRDITATAKSVDATGGKLTAGDDIVLLATAGNVAAATLKSASIAVDSEAPADIGVPVRTVADFPTTADQSVALAGATIGTDFLAVPSHTEALPDPLGAGGTIAALSLAGDRIGQNIIVRASGTATITQAVAAGRDFRVAAGGTVTLGTASAAVAQTAGGRVLVESRGTDVSLLGTLTLTADFAQQSTGDAADLALAAATGIAGSDVSLASLRVVGGAQSGLGSVILTTGTGSIVLDRGDAAAPVIDGGAISVSAPGTIDVKRIRAGGAVTLQGTTASPTANDVAVIVPVSILLDDTDASGFTASPVTLSAGGGTTLTALGFAGGATASTVAVLADTGAATLGRTPATGGSVFTASPGPTNDGVLRIAGALTVESQTGAATIITADGGAGTAAAGSIGVRGRQSGATATATTLHASSDIVVSAPTAKVTTAVADTGSITVAGQGSATLQSGAAPGGDILVGADGTATLGSGTAGRSIAITGATVTIAVTAMAGDDILVTSAGGDATVANVTLTTTAGPLDSQTSDSATAGRTSLVTTSAPATGYGSRYASVLNDATNVASDPLTGMPLTTLLGSNIDVLATGNVAAAGSTISAARDLHVEAGLSATLATLAAGRDLVALAGYQAAGTLTLGGATTAGDDLIAVALRGDVTAANVALSAQGGPDSENASDGAKALFADGVTALADPSGTGQINRLAGANIVVAASGDAAVLTATAARDVRVAAAGSATLTTGGAGRDVLVLARTGSASATSLVAGDDAAVVATGGAATLTTATTTGAGPDAGAALLDLSGAAVTLNGDPSPIGRQDAASVTVAAAGLATVTGAIGSAGRLTIDGRTGIALGEDGSATTQSAARDIQLTASIQPTDANIFLRGTFALTSNSDGLGSGDGIAFRLAQGGIAGIGATVTAARSPASILPGQGIVSVVALQGDGTFTPDPAALPGGIRENPGLGILPAIQFQTVDSTSLSLVARDRIVIGTVIDNSGVSLTSRDASVSLTTAQQIDPGAAASGAVAADRNTVDIALLGATGATLGTTAGPAEGLIRDVTVATIGGTAQVVTQATARDDIVVASSTGSATATLLIASTAGALDSENGKTSAFTGAGGGAFVDPVPVAGLARYTLADRAGSNFIVAGQTGATLNTARTRTGMQDVRVLTDSGAALLGQTDDAANGPAGQLLVISQQGSATAANTTLAAVRAAGDIVVKGGTTASVTGTAKSGGSLIVDAGTFASLGSGTAGGDVTVTGNSVVIGSAVAGDDIVASSATTLTAQTLTAGPGADSETGDDTRALALWNSPTFVRDPVGGGTIIGLAGNNIRLSSKGDLSAGTATAARDITLTTGGVAMVGTANAGRDITATSGADGTVTTGIAGRDIALTAGGAALVGTATSGADGTLTTATAMRDVTLTTSGAAVLTTADAGRDIVVTSGGLATLTTAIEARDITVTSRGAAMVGTAKASQDIVIRAQTTIDFAEAATVPTMPGVALVTAGNDIILNAPVSVTVPGSLSAGNNYIIQSLDDVAAVQSTNGTSGLIALGKYGAGVVQSSGNLILLSASGYTIDPAMVLSAANAKGAGRVQLDIAGGGTTVALGDIANPAVTAPTSLSDAEINTIRATAIEINADAVLPNGSTTPRTVMIGTLTIPTTTTDFAFRARGDIVLSGLLSMPTTGGTVRTLTLGGAVDGGPAAADNDSAVSPLMAFGTGLAAINAPGAVNGIARSVEAITSPDLNGTQASGGGIAAAGSNVRLRADYIALGETPTAASGSPFLSALLPGSGSPPTVDEVRARFLVNAGSSFYLASPVYQRAGAAPAVIVAAGDLQISAGQWALIQNTDVRSQPGGGIVVDHLQTYPVLGPDPVIGVFGAIGTSSGVVASVKLNIPDLHGIDPNNVRVNGCVALSTASCIVTGLDLSAIGLADPSHSLLVRNLPPLDLPFELVGGTGNEALWATDDEAAGTAAETKP